MQYKEIVKTFIGDELNEYKPTKKVIKRFIFFMKDVYDPRKAGMISYPLSEILVIAFLSVLAGFSEWQDIELFGNAKKKWLKKFLVLEYGIPSHDTFRRVFAMIDPVQFGNATVTFLIDNLESIRKTLKLSLEGPRQICVDGKEEKGTGRKYGTDQKVPNLQILNIYDSSLGVFLYSKSIDNKTNEIPVAQEVLANMQLKGCVVTFDSMNTQKDTISVITSKGGDYVAALKGNHPTLHEELKLFFSEDYRKSIANNKTNFYSVKEKAHNQIETRNIYLSTNIKWFEDKHLWSKLKSFICYETKTEHLVTHEITTEIRYYLSSLKDAELCADSIRGHWSIESNHWLLDVVMEEDDLTTMDKNAFNNLAILNKFVLTLYKLVQPLIKCSIRSVRKLFGLSFEDHLAKLLSVLDEDFLENAMQNVKK